MPTALEIIDTATKIGLGALVSGISTYIITRSKYSHDQKREVQNDKRASLKLLTTMLEEATSELNNCIKFYWNSEYGNEELSKNLFTTNIEKLINSVNRINQAKSLSMLIGESELFDKISEYSVIIQKLHNFLYESGYDIDFKKANEFVQDMNDLWDDINISLSKSYSKISNNA